MLLSWTAVFLIIQLTNGQDPVNSKEGSNTPYTLTLDVSFDETPTVMSLILPKDMVGRLVCQSKISDHTSWTKDGGTKVLNKSNTVLVDGSVSSNAGSYRCESEGGFATAHVFIEGSDNPISTHVGVMDPSDNVRDLVVSKEDLVDLEISIDVQPLNLIRYKLIYTRVLDKEAVHIADFPEQDITDQVAASNITSSLRYVIPHARSSDHGLYTFVVDYGTVMKHVTMFLTVTIPPEIKQFRKSPNFVSMGKKVVLAANVSGYPQPDITWFQKPCCPEEGEININELIEVNSREFQFYHLLNDYSVLNLMAGGLKKYNGSFWFTAGNSAGFVKSSVTHYRIRGYGITINSELQESVSRLEEYENIGAIRLTCVVNMLDLANTSDTPLIRWYHNGELLANKSTSHAGPATTQEKLLIPKPKLSDAGVYNCIAENYHQTFWSFDVKVKIVKQPLITVSPKVYNAAEGTTVVFSCNIDNIDGIRGADWDVRYRYKTTQQSFRDISAVYSGNEEGLLYIENVREEIDVRCDPHPAAHSAPIHRDGRTQIVKDPPVRVEIPPIERRYTAGDTLIIRCTIVTNLFSTSSPRIFWKHNNFYLSGPARGEQSLGDGKITERYSIQQQDDQKTEVLIVEDLDEKSAGNYTCIFNDGENGRYEETYVITIHPKPPTTTIALILSICFVLILLIIMCVVLVCLAKRSKIHGSYFVAGKHANND